VVSTFFQPDMGNWSETFWLKINGNVVQKGQMDDMVFDIPFLIEFLSSRLPLLEGDIVFTGTPEGVGTVEKGDILELGLGESVLKTVKFS
jgi:acylpyruvate hydrolase